MKTEKRQTQSAKASSGRRGAGYALERDALPLEPLCVRLYSTNLKSRRTSRDRWPERQRQPGQSPAEARVTAQRSVLVSENDHVLPC